LGTEKNFQRRNGGVLFVSEGLFMVLVGVSGSVFAVLACASMLFSVKFYVVLREVRMLLLCGKENFRRRRQLTSYAFFNYVGVMLG
jgi:hypothetical protein